MTLFTSNPRFGRTSFAWAAASLMLVGAIGCGPEIPEADNAARTSSKSTQITETSTPPPASSSAAQTSSSDGVLSAIQGTYIATLQKVGNGSTLTQPFTFTIGQRVLEGVSWPTLEVTSSGDIGTIEFGSYLTWELYAYGTTYVQHLETSCPDAVRDSHQGLRVFRKRFRKLLQSLEWSFFRGKLFPKTLTSHPSIPPRLRSQDRDRSFTPYLMKAGRIQFRPAFFLSGGAFPCALEDELAAIQNPD